MTMVSVMRIENLVSVIFFQFLEIFAVNLQHADLSGQISDISLPSITFGNNTDRIHIEYPVPGIEYDQSVDQSSLDTWSVIWYIASFGGLILFFLIISCSEWCCRRNARRNCQLNNNSQQTSQVVPDTPPPSYDLFAPPSYEDLWVGSSRGRRGEKSEYDIYVVPVHALGTIMEEARREDAPPSYQSASTNLAHPGDLQEVYLSTGTTRVT
ncbi:unnamed protein product [Ceutorhynchus assimilis]|uniref:Uncharacterized protein n=1 Tax=Ceutorhynchus assimilis TaxID=467358 RepID=A0A9N9MA43_9CUCU|nr:unnamed protein product [Ceutorhynchus assimilis]